MNWATFSLNQHEYKMPEKKLILVDNNNNQSLQITARIRQTAQTDVELTFYCSNVLVNMTD